MNDPTKKLLLPNELARILNVSVAWVYVHATPTAKKAIPVKRVGNLLRFDLDEVMAALDQQEVSNG